MQDAAQRPFVVSESRETGKAWYPLNSEDIVLVRNNKGSITPRHGVCCTLLDWGGFLRWSWKLQEAKP